VQLRIGPKIFPLWVLWFALFAANSAWAHPPRPVGAAQPQSDQDSLFNQAVDAYKQNQFSAALEKFQQVSGPHAQEAHEYISQIKAYKEAMTVAKSSLDRSPDEQDARSLAYAIERLQEAIKIKPDGPWQPAQLLDKARRLKAAVEESHAERTKTADRGLCDKALAAAEQHHYKEAAQISCLLAEDNPGYSCGGDEAVHICSLDTEMAKMDKSTPDVPVKGSQGNEAQVKPSTHSADLDKARAAYDGNDFARARSLFQKVTGDSKPTADEFLDKISRYTDWFANGEKLNRDGRYDQARTAFLSAASIKADGPGKPQNRASAMELLLGLDQFYSGDYVSAAQHLEACTKTETGKQSFVRFYLGASKLARFFVTGAEDSALHEEALNDLKMAKQSGFKTTGQDVSPKILKVYKDLSF
jgi:tetratricopeptide (TPR) repeat protein